MKQNAFEYSAEELARSKSEAKSKQDELRRVRALVAASQERWLATDALSHNPGPLPTSLSSLRSPPLSQLVPKGAAGRLTRSYGSDYYTESIEGSGTGLETVATQKQQSEPRSPVPELYINQDSSWMPPQADDGNIVRDPTQLKSPSSKWLDLRADKEAEATPSNAEIREQTAGALFLEDTVADSGYVSACLPTAVPDSESDQKLKGCESMESPETLSRSAADQHTVYTSSILPHGSDLVRDLCTDIHKKLKYELQNYADYRGRIELPEYLPDLIKAFSIRMGLDTSEPSRAYIMSYLHTSHRYVQQTCMSVNVSI